jgi:hypothetical protein
MLRSSCVTPLWAARGGLARLWFWVECDRREGGVSCVEVLKVGWSVQPLVLCGMWSAWWVLRQVFPVIAEVVMARWPVFGSRAVFRLWILLCLCRALLCGVPCVNLGRPQAIWGVYQQFGGSAHYLKNPCLFENTHGFRKIYGQFERSIGYHESLCVIIIDMFPL